MYSQGLKVLAFTADNASNNNTLVDELGQLLDGFGGSPARVRCFAHILNLVVKVTPVTASLAAHLIGLLIVI
jgi:hypothetical protein